MITKDNFKTVLTQLNFTQNDNIFYKTYNNGEFALSVDFTPNNEKFNYPAELKAERGTTLDFHQNESFVVFECVTRLFDIGYKPKNITLEGKNYEGQNQGWIDILVKNAETDQEFMIIECKTSSENDKKESEFEKHWKRTLNNGDQLFRYFNTYRKAEVLCLYTADLVDEKLVNTYNAIVLKDNEEYLRSNKKGFEKNFAYWRSEQGSSQEFFNVWKDIYLLDYTTNGFFESDCKPFSINKKKMTFDDLKEIDSVSMQKKYYEFASILRTHNVSSKENAFDKLINIFLSKIVDETENKNELKCLWKGAANDSYFEMQDRLLDLYKMGMEKYFKETIENVNEKDIEKAFAFLEGQKDVAKAQILEYFRTLKYFSNNPFSFLDVYNEDLFYKNAVILKEIINMVSDIKIKTEKQNQFLGDLFEGFLDQGIKQSEGQFFTPLPIVKFLVSSLPLENVIKNNAEIPNVIDYACGAGHFLTEYANQIKPIVEKFGKTDVEQYYSHIYGIEKENRLSKVSKVSTFMYGYNGIQIEYKDALQKIDAIKEESFTFLIANPPYSVKGFLTTLDTDEREKYELYSDDLNIDSNNSIEVFFVERAKQLLKDDGMAAIILPSSVLSNGNIYIKCREIILKYFDLVAIFESGAGTFGKTGTNTATLFLKKRKTNPCFEEHCQNRVDTWFNKNLEEATKEKFATEIYCDYGFIKEYCQMQKIDFEEYKNFLKGILSEKLLEHQLFADYKKLFENDANAKKILKKKITPKYTKQNQTQELQKYIFDAIKEIEKEKVKFFMLVKTNQDVLLVKSPNDNKEIKKFLGYEWSASKNNEGIKYLGVNTYGDDEENAINKNKGIEGINTPLFNPKDFSDSTKINTLIRQNFLKQDFTIAENLKPFVTKASLIDMLDFSRTTFDKAIKTNITKKVEIKSKWDLVKLGDVAEVKKGKSITSSETTKGDIKVVAGGIDFAYLHNQANREANIITVSASGANAGFVNYWAEPIFASDCTTIQAKTDIETKYIFNFLKANQELIFDLQKGAAQPHVYPDDLEKFSIPLPPLETQKQIVAECQKIDTAYNNAKTQIEELKAEIENIMQNVTGEMKKLGDIGEVKMCKRIMKNETNSEKGIPFYKIGTFGKVADAFIDEQLFEKYVKEYPYPKKGEILISAAGTLGKTVVFDGEPAYFQDSNIVWLQNDEKLVLNSYLAISLKFVKWENYITDGSVIPRIYNGQLREVSIPVPPLAEQEKIVKQIADYEKQITSAKNLLATCPEQKQKVLDDWL